MDDLVKRLSDAPQEVAVGGPAPTTEEFQRRLTELGYVFLKFPNTRGGTDLGVRVDPSATDLTSADFLRASGVAHVEGTLVLNEVPVRCVADVDVGTLSGTGHVVPMLDT